MAKKKTTITFESLFKEHMQKLGSTGGKNAAANMTPEQRSERARKAVAARKVRVVAPDATTE